MLTHIHIKNFVIVKSLSLDFQNGLHVLTGETGAGKSIWIDAIAIALGGRADAQLIYAGEKTGEITVCFDLRKLPEAKAWLTSHDLPTDDECVIRRVIDLEKPSRTTLNGTPVPQQWVRELSETLLSIHGQHQHQLLLKSDYQRNLIDRFAGNDDLLLQIHSQFDEWKSLDREIQLLQKQMQNKSSDLNLWQYQLDELQALSIAENEYENLFSRYQQLHHAKKFATALHEALTMIASDEHPSACDLAEKSLQQVNHIQADDPKIDNIRSLLQTATIHLDEARDALEAYCYENDFSTEHLEQIESRLAVLQDIARKHHIDPTQLNDVERSLQHKINLLSQADETLADLEKQKNNIVTTYHEIAKKLTQKRQKAAKQLSTAITEHMQQLGMKGGKFEVKLTPLQTPIHTHGQEDIHFLIATNPGQTPHDLCDIVSGGELSRLSLIIQVLTASQKNTATLIFDEVDVGVGGQTADLIGRLLRKLGENTQVLCVTHLPQVAACGHHHFRAGKISDGKCTSTHIALLSEKERTVELARMLSGSTITEKSLEHANELLATVG